MTFSPVIVFLSDHDLPVDTNYLERALRPIPMGRKNWLFCWTELGAQQVGIIQSSLMTCTLLGINPYTYLVDVLQRISQHPASRLIELTPRVWKETFADNPLYQSWIVVTVDIDKMTRDELVVLNHPIVERLKFLDSLQAHRDMMVFNIGARVSFDSERGERLLGTLLKFNRKTVMVVIDN